MFSSSDSSDSEEFNGEFVPKLSTDYKIPKATPKKPKKNEKQKENNNKDKKEDEAEYSSPLKIVEKSLDELVATVEFIENGEEIVPRKRKLSPPPTVQDPPPPKVSKPVPSKLPGRSTEFPNELNELFQPLTCNLCKAPFTSIKVAWSHYESKSHAKKATTWLKDWTEKNGGSMPTIPKQIKEGTAGPNAYRCEACDLPLTSLVHANQHYSGKKHKMVVENLSKPSGSGYYDKNGKWVRQATKITTDSRYGIGESFRKTADGDQKSDSETLKKSARDTTKKPEAEKPKKSATTIHCDVCNIDLSSDAQMQEHLKGSKHAKKLKSSDKPPHVPASDTVLASVNKTDKDDMSMYRTPTGSYYCKTCDFSLLDPTHMKQHLSGKRHAKNLKSKSSVDGKSDIKASN